jgi:hypothetical protein
MEQTQASVGDVNSGRRALLMGWNLFLLLLHLAVVYLIAKTCVAWLAGQIHDFWLPLLQTPSTESSFQFLFAHLLPLSIFSGSVGGLVTSGYRHSAARYVWIVPVAVLAYKFAAFPSGVFESHFHAASQHYFAGGFLIGEFHNYRELFQIVGSSHDATRGLDQLEVTAPAYVAISYSGTNWIAMRLNLRLPGVEAVIAKFERNKM